MHGPAFPASEPQPEIVSKPQVMTRTLLLVFLLALVLAPLAPAQSDEPARVLIRNVNVWDGISNSVRSGVEVL